MSWGSSGRSRAAAANASRLIGSLFRSPALLSATFVLGQSDPDREIWRIRLLIVAGIGRHIRHHAGELWCHTLVEGREADECLLARPHLVDIIGLQPRLDLQVI